jgi:UDP-glucose 4-epimerase
MIELPKTTPKNILVTGVAGFMGSHLAEYLANQGHHVTGIDNLSIGKIHNIPENIIFKRVDLRDAEATAKVVAETKPELVYHLACWAHEGLSQFMPRHITENNYNAFLNLITPAINHGMRRIVVCSSMSVYGDQQPPFDESLPKRPVDVYAVAKAAMEDTTAILADVHGFDFTIIRPHNVYGPRQIIWDPYRNVAGIFVNRIMNKLPPVIYGDGEQTRAFSYIDDVTPYIAKAGMIEETKGEIINVGPLENYSINELARTVLTAFGSDMEPHYEPDRPREVKHAYCTNEKAVRLLGYQTSVTLQQGIQRMVDWARGIGPQQFQYLDELELTGEKVPDMWKHRLM